MAKVKFNNRGKVHYSKWVGKIGFSNGAFTHCGKLCTTSNIYFNDYLVNCKTCKRVIEKDISFLNKEMETLRSL